MLRQLINKAAKEVLGEALEGKLGKNAEILLAEKLTLLSPEGYTYEVTKGSKSCDILVRLNGILAGYVEVKARTGFHRKIEWGAVSNKRGFIGRSLYDPKQRKYRDLFFVYLHVAEDTIEQSFVRHFTEVKFYRSGGRGKEKNVSIEYFNGKDYSAKGFKFKFDDAVKMLRQSAGLKV